MKQTIKIIVREYTTKKDGKKFIKATAKGQYLPLALVDDETNYNIKFVGEALPNQEGIYEVAFEQGNLWLDQRPDVAELNIVRCRPSKVVFHKYLPKLDKDIRG